MLIPDDLDMELDEFVERYETASAAQPGLDVAEYLPSEQHPRYVEIACELLRVHMELSAATGKLISAEDYRLLYPLVCQSSLHFKALQTEEARVRASSRVKDPSASISRVSQARSTSASGSSERVEMPKSGQSVCGFQLIAELGRGAFSEVFLAQDDSLSQRRVVLKISSKLLGEADLLSRLQHKNIVPVYSLHKHGQYHLICMPFLGTMTLGDMLSAQPKASSALSGKELISTLAAQASRTWREGEAATASVPIYHEPSDAPPLDRGLSSQLAAEVSRMSTTELALWIVSELADGLAHAHQRGVLHRDIKPANILLSDDGLPMLLDFNLAASTRADGKSHQVVGGTLRYMSPEQLQSVQSGRSTLDARADVFGLAVVLYELLYRRAPFVDRTGSWDEVLKQMLDDRRSLPTMELQWREGLTPAVLSILGRALAFDPQQRYQSASEFRDDLRAHLQSRPLPTAHDRSLRERMRKWNVRHPRMSSMTLAVASIAMILCGTIAWTVQRQSQLNRLTASQWLTRLEHVQSDARLLLASDAAPTAAVKKWLEQSSSVLTNDLPLTLSRLPDSEAARAKQYLGRLHFYRARGAIGLLDRDSPDKKSRWLELALDELKRAQSYERTDLATRWQESLTKLAGHDASAAQGLGTRLVSAQSPAAQAMRFKVDSDTLDRELTAAMASVHAEASNPWHWVGVGQIQLALGKVEPAAASFMLGHNLSNREPMPTFFLGLVEMKRKNFRAAEDWFTFTLAQDAQCWEAWFNRAASRVELGQLSEAVTDLDAMGEQADRFPRAWFIREIAETRLGKTEEAARSRQRGLKLMPNDALAWNARGQARLRQKPVDAEGALADFETAIALDPQLRNAYENAAHVLSERLKQPQAAIERLSEVLQVDPEYALAWSSRAVLLARQGDYDGCMKDVQQALKIDRSPMICYQCASALALRDTALKEGNLANTTAGKDANSNEDKQQGEALSNDLSSLQLLKETLRKDPSLSRFMRKDQDLGALLGNPQFQELMNAAARLQ